MKLEILPPPRWAAVSGEWNALLERASDATIFLCPEWITAWWRWYGGEYEAKMIAAWDEREGLVGLAPLYTRRKSVASMSAMIVGVIGDQWVGSEYQGLLASPGREAEFVSALAEILDRGWAVLDFQGLREGGRLVRVIPEVVAARARYRMLCERHVCSRIELPREYETYMGLLGQKFRSTLRQRTNKLLKHHSVRMLWTQREEDLEPHLDRFFALHQERWQSKGYPGSFGDDRLRGFYRDVAAGFLRRGWLRFCHLEIDGVIYASQFGFVFAGALHSLQEAFSISFQPPGIGGLGVILRSFAIRECIHEGLRVYDFLGGAEEFKTRWMTTPQYIQRIRIGAPGLAGTLAFGATAGVDIAKQWGRTHLPQWLLQARNWMTRGRLGHVTPNVKTVGMS